MRPVNGGSEGTSGVVGRQVATWGKGGILDRTACAKALWKERLGTFEHPLKCQFPLSVSVLGLRKEFWFIDVP